MPAHISPDQFVTRLESLLTGTSAEAALVMRKDAILASAGADTEALNAELVGHLMLAWDKTLQGEMVRDCVLGEKEHLLYSTPLAGDTVLALVYDTVVPLGQITSQVRQLTQELDWEEKKGIEQAAPEVSFEVETFDLASLLAEMPPPRPELSSASQSGWELEAPEEPAQEGLDSLLPWNQPGYEDGRPFSWDEEDELEEQVILKSLIKETHEPSEQPSGSSTALSEEPPTFKSTEAAPFLALEGAVLPESPVVNQPPLLMDEGEPELAERPDWLWSQTPTSVGEPESGSSVLSEVQAEAEDYSIELTGPAADWLFDHTQAPEPIEALEALPEEETFEPTGETPDWLWEETPQPDTGAAEENAPQLPLEPALLPEGKAELSEASPSPTEWLWEAPIEAENQVEETEAQDAAVYTAQLPPIFDQAEEPLDNAAEAPTWLWLPDGADQKGSLAAADGTPVQPFPEGMVLPQEDETVNWHWAGWQEEIPIPKSPTTEVLKPTFEINEEGDFSWEWSPAGEEPSVSQPSIPFLEEENNAPEQEMNWSWEPAQPSYEVHSALEAPALENPWWDQPLHSEPEENAFSPMLEEPVAEVNASEGGQAYVSLKEWEIGELREKDAPGWVSSPLPAEAQEAMEEYDSWELAQPNIAEEPIRPFFTAPGGTPALITPYPAQPVDPMAETRPFSPQLLSPQQNMIESQLAAGFRSSFCVTIMLVPYFPEHLLKDELSGHLRGWMIELCQGLGWNLVKIKIHPKFLLWAVQEALPVVSVGNFIYNIRQHTSRRLYKEYPDLRYKYPTANLFQRLACTFSPLKYENRSGDFWAPGYLLVNGTQPPSAEALREFLRNVRRRQGIDHI
jgi:hypothetical protein